jgi:Zn-dependent M28 family amino/carboxypeptidase
VYPLATTVGVINMDALSPTGLARNFTISGSAKLDLLDQLIAKAKQYNLAYTPDPLPEAGHFFRSDHFPFAKRGVPAISYGSGNDLVDGGVEAGRKEEEAYTTNNYHQPSDEWSAAGASPACRTTWACCTRWAAIWRNPRTGLTGPRMPSSAPRATPAPPSASKLPAR